MTDSFAQDDLDAAVSDETGESNRDRKDALAASADDAVSTSPAEQRRRAAAIACGYTRDETGAREHLKDKSPKVRAAALASLARIGKLSEADMAIGIHDQDPFVRRATCEVAAKANQRQIRTLLHDSDPRVVEACAFALGELEDRQSVLDLIHVAANHSDPLCRESAVAALGAIGDESSRGTILCALEDSAPIRRRALIALANFEGDDVERAIRSHLTDRDWQVRQAAEDLLDLSAEEQK